MSSASIQDERSTAICDDEQQWSQAMATRSRCSRSLYRTAWTARGAGRLR